MEFRPVAAAQLILGAARVLAASAATVGVALCAGCDRGSPAPGGAANSTAPASDSRDRAPDSIAHALLVSVDGLRPECLEPPLLEQLPAFARLLRGPHTLDARTDPDYTITLPNHLSMLTGRPVLGPSGHAWIGNDDPPGLRQGGTVHALRGAYVASAFDVAHDAGLVTAAIASKTKFWLLEQSYSSDFGAPDTVVPDHGKAKIDRFVAARSMDDVARATLWHLETAAGRSFAFVHFAAPDAAGHAEGWLVEPTSRYFAAVMETDRALGRLLDGLDRNPTLRGRVGIVLTADHGGGLPLKTHTEKSSGLNFRIPFLVWLGSDRAPSDLAAVNPSRPRPDPATNPPFDGTPAPIRNGDAGNAALRLLGLPSIPESSYGRLWPLTVPTDRP
jgi:hypothetical protein